MDDIFLSAVELQRKGRLTEALTLIEKNREDYNTILLRCLEARIYERMGKYKQAMEIVISAEGKAIEDQNISALVLSYVVKSYIYVREGEISNAEESLIQGERIIEDIGGWQHLKYSEFWGLLINSKGLIANLKGRLNEAMNYFSIAYRFGVEYSHLWIESTARNNLALCLKFTRNHDEAILHINRGIEILDELENFVVKGVCLKTLGELHRIKGYLQQASEYLEQSLQLVRNENITHHSTTLYYLILTYLEMGNTSKVKILEEELYNIQISSDNKMVKKRYEITHALILKTEKRFETLGEAKKILLDVVKSGMIDFDLTTTSIINLLDILLYEYKCFKNPAILVEINNELDSLLNYTSGLETTLIHLYLTFIKGKAALLNFNFEESKRFLLQSQVQAEELGFEILALEISNELDKYMDLFDKWTDLKYDSIGIEEMLKYVEFEETFISSNIHLQSEFIEGEEPVKLFLIDNKGTSIYSFDFHSIEKLNDQLIGGFLTAINHALSETFQEKSTIERIKYGDYTILMRQEIDINYCYVFKGKSYKAYRKLSEFIDQITDSNIINNYYTRNPSIGETKYAIPENELHPLVSQIFLENG
ncbi:MAG: tetratricopeptide repeat protein [Candidatus Heimdallarchaeota archaeon]|nr:tetratricopeptide repeat protein [Candidatus Heimdallarchaeota archaeon]MDH5645387.1 tetratricopeptide repeat protein [Candidatus Heimdallarchaeota archaeon]